MLERIEVLKGPTSALYGQGSAGGFVNMITKRPSLEAKNEVFTTIGSHNRYETGFDLNGALDKDQNWLYRVVGLGRMADTQVDFQRDERVLIAPSLSWQPTDDTSLTLQAMYQHDPQSPDAGFVWPMGSLFDLPGFGKLPTSFYQGDPGFMEYKRTEASIGYQFDHRFNETLKFHSNARYSYMESSTKTIENALNNISYTDGAWANEDAEIAPGLTICQFFNDYVYMNTDPRFPCGGMAPNQIPRGWYAAEHEGHSFSIDNNLTAEFDTGQLDHRLLVGVDYLNMSGKQRYNAGGGQDLITGDWYGGDKGAWYWDAFNPIYGYDFSELDAKGLPYQRDQKLTQTGIYIQDQIEWDRWRLTLSGRHDWSYQYNREFIPSAGIERTKGEVRDQAFTGRAALAYVFESGFVPFVGYATSFDPVSLSSALNVDGVSFEPQTGWGFETGLRYQNPDNGLYLSATYFAGEKEGFPIPTGSGTGCGAFFATTCYTSETKGKVQGIELEARGEVLAGLDVIANYTYTDAKVLTLGQRGEAQLAYLKANYGVPEGFRPSPVGVPEHMASLWTNYKFPEGPLGGLSIGGGVRYVGKTPATFLNYWYMSGNYQEYSSPPVTMLDPDGFENDGKRAFVPSRTLFDLAVSYDFGVQSLNLEGLNLTVTATNLFDKKFVAACWGYGTCNYGEGREIKATLKYRW